jgi:hypothetical protein
MERDRFAERLLSYPIHSNNLSAKTDKGKVIYISCSNHGYG